MSRAKDVRSRGLPPPPPPPTYPPPPRSGARRPSEPPPQEYNMHYAKSVTLMLGLENTLNIFTHISISTLQHGTLNLKLLKNETILRCFRHGHQCGFLRAGEVCTLKITPGINHSIIGRWRRLCYDTALLQFFLYLPSSER